jgi:putative membrane protein
MPKNWKLPLFLLILYIIVFIILAISPYNREVWFAENLPIMLIVIILAALYFRGYKFSNLAYVLMSFLIFIHTIGGHYTFERVPFGFITDLFGFERNHYDRIGHFTVGFYAFAVMEFLVRYKVAKNRLAAFCFALFSIMALAAAYEIFEWGFAMVADPEAGISVLGSQGDVWDAQKDMLLDTLGAILSLGLFFVLEKRKKKDSAR